MGSEKGFLFMRINIIVIILVIICSYSYAGSQSIEDAVNTINKFCELDSAGYRLLDKYDPAEIARYALDYSTESRDGYIVITGYHIVRCMVQGSRAEADVVFYYVDPANPYVVNDQDIWQKFELMLNDENRWLIVSDVGKPKVSISAYITHLNSNLKAEEITEQDIPAINRKIQNLTAIKESPQKERYSVNPQFKDLEIGLNEDEVDIPVDSTIIMHQDMTFDGKPEKIFINVRGESQINPFTWSVNIVDGEKTIFSYRANTQWNDRNFYHKDYFRGAKSYIDSKRKYYFEYIPEKIIRFDAYSNSVVSKNAPNGAYLLIIDQLVKLYNMDREKAKEIAERTLDRLKAGAYYIAIPMGNQSSPHPKIYIEEVGTFLIFYMA